MRIEFLDYAGNVLGEGRNSTVQNFSRKFYSGSGIINVPRYSFEDNDNYIKYGNLVKIKMWSISENKYISIFLGRIQSIRNSGSVKSLGLFSMFDILKKRFTTVSETLTGQAGQEMFDLLDTANAEKETGITKGTNSVTTSINIEEQENDFYNTFIDIVNDSNSEFDITADGELNILPRLGADKTGSITISYVEGRLSLSNIENPSIDIDGNNFANRIIAKSKDGSGSDIRKVVNDLASQLQFGLVVEKIRIDSAQNITDLETMATEILNQKSGKYEDIKVVPLPIRSVENKIGETVLAGFDIFDFNLGDDINLEYKDGDNEIFESRRILAISLTKRDNIDRINLSLSKTGITRTALDESGNKEEREELFRRIRLIEDII